MRTEDLMAGDWVKSRRYIGPSKVYATHLKPYDERFAVIIINETEDGTVIAGHSMNDIAPIPISEEILMNNGFIEDFEHSLCYWRPDCRKFCFVKELDTWYFAFRINDGGYICIAECNYVHQLQHALKFIGVETDVIL